MSGIHQMLIYARGNNVIVTFPPDPGLGLTTVYGTHVIYAGAPPPAVGSLQVDNTTGSDSAHTYVTALPSNIINSVQRAQSGYTVGSPLLQGMFARGSLQATPVVLHNGYRLDYTNPFIRLIRFDAGAATVLDSINLAALTPTFDYYLAVGNTDVTFHMTDLGSNNAITGWLTAPGQPDTPMVTATGAATLSYISGRIGFLSFFNVAGAGGPNYWTNYAASWNV